jgi:type I restriction enzyme S subunit
LLESLIAEAQRAINLLQERRDALVSAAVTGKIDVRDLVPAKAEAA